MSREKEIQEWLNGLAVGEKVVALGGGWSASYEVLTIERMTETQFVMSNGTRFRRSSGYIVGDGYRRIEPITQAVRDKIEMAKLEQWVRLLPDLFRSGKPFPLEQLRAAKAAFEAGAKP